MSYEWLLVLIPIVVTIAVVVVFKARNKEPENTIQSRAGGNGKQRTR